MNLSEDVLVVSEMRDVGSQTLSNAVHEEFDRERSKIQIRSILSVLTARKNP